tara:strand:+ start:239 stop:1081 length:843 start_codon:yes stop_codon:yes gene_type:complete
MNINNKNIILLIASSFLAIFIIAIILISNFSKDENPNYNAINPQFATPTPIPPERDDYVPAPTPTPVPTPTPEIPSFGGLFIAELSNELGISPSNISVNSYEGVIFNDTSLDCPEPGYFYAQVLTPGWKINLSANNNIYSYHSNLDGSNYINCTLNNSIVSSNLYEEFKLYNTKNIKIERLKDGDFVLLKEIKGEESKLLIESLNLPIINSESIKCTYLYKVSFIFENEELKLLCICDDGKNYGKINKVENKIYELPKEYMDIIGKHSSSLGFPGMPKRD